jgi:hypothetical protein
MPRVQRALRTLLVLSGVTLGTVAAAAVVLGVLVLGLVGLEVGAASNLPLLSGD